MQITRNKIFHNYILLAFLVIVVSGCATTSYSNNPELQKKANERITQIKNIAILPPDTRVILQSFAGDPKPLPEKEKVAKAELISGMKESVNTRGFESQYIDTGSEQFEADVRYEIQQLSDLYQKFRAEEMKNTEELPSIGPMVNTLSGLVGADAFLVSNYNGIEKSGGQVTKEIVSSMLFAVLTGVVVAAPASAAQLDMALVDGVTGDILWTKKLQSAQNAKVLVEKVMEDMPGVEGYEITKSSETIETEDFE